MTGWDHAARLFLFVLGMACFLVENWMSIAAGSASLLAAALWRGSKAVAGEVSRP